MSVQILSEISELMTDGAMRHMQFADMMDFLGCRGFKRMAEYCFYKDCIHVRKLHRYAINHCNKFIVEKNITSPKVIPQSWEGATRQQVDENTRQKYIRQLFTAWLDYEKETRVKLSQKYKVAHESSNYHVQEKIMHLLEENEMHIKKLERMVLEYNAVDWNMLYIMQQQKPMHDYYREKTKEVFE